MTTFGTNLRTLRKQLGISQGVFADRIGVHRISVANYESGTLKPSYDMLEKISATFGVNIGWLVSGQGQMVVGAFSTDKADSDMQELMEFLHAHPEQKKLLLDVMRVQKKAVEGMDALAKPPRRLRPRPT